MSEIKAFQFDANSPIEISTGVNMQLSDAGTKRYLLSTPRIEKFLIDNEEIYQFPIGFQLRTYDSLGVEVTKISAKKGIMKQKLGEIVLTDSVRIRNINAERLATDLLFVFVEKDSLFTDKPVTVSSLAGTLTGKFGLTSNLNFTEYKLNKVFGEIETKEMYNEQESE
ncbi:MAG: LPS export ABC transporter periplasmic protein LptC [Crocinitomicaceae bacterium]|jgi:LPS export ABC transporter protein LptC|nr:LPS export ABC transporter periplasmic protein LptC [Crocinitomicaceae bacterium]